MAVFSAIFFTMAASAEIVTGHIEATYKEQITVNNDWTFDTDTGLLTIKSISNDYDEYNECGRATSANGGWVKYRKAIKKVVLDGVFKKITYGAFTDYTSLEEVVITADIGQVDHNAFNGCTSLHTICVDEYIRIEGVADLRNVPQIATGILAKTQIKTLFSSADASASIAEDALPDGITEIYGAAGSVFETYASEKGIEYSVRDWYIDVDILSSDGRIYNTFSVPFGMKLKDYSAGENGSVICLFEDKEYTKVYDNTQHITESQTLYAKEILSFDGWSVRIRDYKGLRAVFEYDTVNFGDNEKFEIIKVGAIAGKNEYALNDFTLGTEGTEMLVVYENGNNVGATLYAPENGRVKFAISAVGFEGSEEEFTERSLQNIVFRAFVIVLDKQTGEEYTYYTDAIGSTLAFVSKEYLESSIAEQLNQEEKNFVFETVNLTRGKGEDARYDKETLMELLTEIYNDNGKLLVGEQINMNSSTPQNVIAPFVEATGEVPSIIGMDLSCYGIDLMTTTEEHRTKYLKELIDYCRDGGVITASSHFYNPNPMNTAANCRGYLEEDMWEELLKEGTALNRVFKRELNTDAAFLRELANNDIPVLWRPFHEMNLDGTFWWCVKQNGYTVDAEIFHEMWKYVYKYYVEELGLNNLIWVYAPNNDTGNYIDVEYCYPGYEYVDMTGLDWYTSGGFEIGSDEGAYLRMMDYGMPVALTEYGSGGKLNSIQTWEDIQKMYEKGMKLTYILTWSDTHTLINCGKADEFMAKPDTLSAEEVHAMFKSKELS